MYRNIFYFCSDVSMKQRCKDTQKNNTMRKKIELRDVRMRQTIAQTFGVTSQFVGLALRYERNSIRAKKIRAMALNHGGVLYREVKN